MLIRKKDVQEIIRRHPKNATTLSIYHAVAQLGNVQPVCKQCVWWNKKVGTCNLLGIKIVHPAEFYCQKGVEV